ncbi:DNA polymerase [Klebsiella phage vB_KpM_Centimanus]
MKVANPFTRTAKDYKRDLGVHESYVIQTALFIQRSTGRPFEECRQFVIDELNNPETGLVDPTFCMLERDENLDQSPIMIPFSKYLSDILENEWLMAPTFTVVLPPHQKLSLLSEYIKGNLKKRSAEKHEMFEAKKVGNTIKATFHNNNQNNKKILNNAISGNHRSEHSPLYDRSTHPVLTSCCRIANGIANSNNDRLLSGSRHYWRPDVLYANLSSILELTDWTKVKETVDKFKLHIPTLEETMDVLSYSSDLYWRSEGGDKNLRRFLRGCSDYERAAFVYMGDLYHLRQFNDALVRDLVRGLVTPASEPVEDYIGWMKHVDEDTMAQITVMFPEIIGKNNPWHDDVKAHPDYWKLGSTCATIYYTLDKYKEIIDTFLMSRNIPFLISDFPHAVRRAGVGSDTDSAIFTVQDWIRWYSDNDLLTPENIVLAEGIAFLVSQTTTHNLATMTVNMGVQEEKEVFRLSMKNEYLFPVFMLTSRAKHYAANKRVQEGVYIHDREKKGVELIASNSPAGVRKDLDLMIEEIVDKVTAGETLELGKYLRWVARWEYTIYESIRRGETTYLKAARVKEEDGYTKKTEDQNTPYLNYELWQEVFAPRFGRIEPPPYSALAFSIVHDTKKKTEKWLTQWKDQQMAERMRRFLAAKNKPYIGRILLPESIVMSIGIPSDILEATNIRKIIGSAMSPFYLVLESLEYYLFDKDQSKLIFDQIPREDAFSDFNEVESALRPKEPVEYLED